jgi:UDP-N-acetylglucosamine enolpyruvyl transferase
MTLNQLASLVAKREGKKHQASVGDVRELLAIIAELIVTDMEVASALVRAGLKRKGLSTRVRKARK